MRRFDIGFRISGFSLDRQFGIGNAWLVSEASDQLCGNYSLEVGQHPATRAKFGALLIGGTPRACQDESDTIVSGALRRLTVSGSKLDKNAL
jgi:hypothetical protein